MKTITKLWLFLAALIIISPIGLIIPAYFKAGAAWGEWAPEEVKGLIGYIPRGIEKLSAAWSAPLPDYCVRGLGENAGYAASAAMGIIVTVGIVYLAGRFLSRK
jgi:hypothetical protein